jgi:hypothetical protein
VGSTSSNTLESTKKQAFVSHFKHFKGTNTQKNMFFIGFLIGLVLGFLLKLGFDEYHRLKKEQETTQAQMEDVLVRFKTLEELKKIKIND